MWAVHYLYIIDNIYIYTVYTIYTIYIFLFFIIFFHISGQLSTKSMLFYSIMKNIPSASLVIQHIVSCCGLGRQFYCTIKIKYVKSTVQNGSCYCQNFIFKYGSNILGFSRFTINWQFYENWLLFYEYYEFRWTVLLWELICIAALRDFVA